MGPTDFPYSFPAFCVVLRFSTQSWRLPRSFEEINAEMADSHIQHYISSLHGFVNAGEAIFLDDCLFLRLRVKGDLTVGPFGGPFGEMSPALDCRSQTQQNRSIRKKI
jgi:hypothetical protein